MKRPKSHKINEKGMRIFESAIPENWVANPQSKDYGKDFVVEIGNPCDELSGESFYVQLKSTANVKKLKTGKFIIQDLESRHARYFANVKDLPVYLIVVDVNSGNGWFVFLQPILLANQSWKYNRQISIRIPEDNLLTDHDALLQDVQNAKKWLRAHHPSAIFDAIEAKKQQLKHIDSRFEPILSYKDNCLNIRMCPTEFVPLTIQVKCTSATEKIRNVIELGKPATFSSAEVSISGSPLFDDLKSSEISLYPDKNHAILLFSNTSSISESTFRTSEFHAIVEGGTKQIAFYSKVEGSPLMIEVIINTEKESPASIKFGIDPCVWNDAPISQLQHLSTAIELFALLKKRGKVYLHLIKDGNPISSSMFEVDDSNLILPIYEFLIDIRKAQDFAKRFNVNPFWDLESFEKMRVELLKFHDLVDTGIWIGPCPHLELAGKIKPNSSEAVRQVVNDGKHYRQLLLTSEIWFDFFGEEVRLGKIVQEFSEMRPELGSSNSRNSGRKRKRQIASTPTTIPFRFIASKSCVQTLRFAKDEE
ncbi:MAG: DUF4365 domain-containing protein [Pirellulaceae bacterium]|nr:DUF4365 domain-containing protein [Pirellulaceae bacterium]